MNLRFLKNRYPQSLALFIGLVVFVMTAINGLPFCQEVWAHASEKVVHLECQHQRVQHRHHHHHQLVNFENGAVRRVQRSPLEKRLLALPQLGFETLASLLSYWDFAAQGLLAQPPPRPPAIHQSLSTVVLLI